MNPIPEHLSYSTLMQWERCPHQYLLQKVAEAPQKPAIYFAGGTAVHLMTEALDTGQAPPGAKFEDYFYPEVERLMEKDDGLYWDHRKWLKGSDSLDDWLEIGPRCVENWRTWVDGKEIGQVEWDITDTLPECPVPIKAFSDRVVADGGHETLIDMKSGKSVPKDRFQLETYISLIGRPMMAAFFMNRDAKVSKMGFTQPMPEEVGERYGRAYREMQEAAETGEYPAKREFTCKWCPMQDACLAYSGDTKFAKEHDPYYAQGKPVY